MLNKSQEGCVRQGGRPEKLQRRMHICKMAEKVEGVKISGQNIVGKDCTAVLFGNIFYAKLTFLPPP